MKNLAGKATLIILLLSLGCKEEIGPAGRNSLINVTAEVSGANCPSGGYKVETGIDLNSDNVLSSNEVQSTVYICNGGSSLVQTLAENPGVNCPVGGFKVL